MKYVCALIVVSDMERSRKFYETILKQEVLADFGENVSFKCGFALHKKEHFAGLIGKGPEEIIKSSNNFELYFEEDELDPLYEKLLENEIEWLHRKREQPWGQRVMRFYDPDQHIIEIGETMEAVVRRFHSSGMNKDEIHRKTMMPEIFIDEALSGIGLK